MEVLMGLGAVLGGALGLYLMLIGLSKLFDIWKGKRPDTD